MGNTLINFVHIPKTAGTTFISILKNNYRPSRRLQIDGLNPDESWVQFEKMGKHLDDVDLLMGHLSLKFEKLFPSRAIERIVYLREPVSHFLSSYFYIKKTKVHAQHEIANSLDLRDFLYYRKTMNLDNIQTRHLAGIATNMTRGQIELNDAPSEHLREAIRQLEASTYVFITEQFDRSLLILRRQKVLRRIQYKKQNISGSNFAVVSAELASEILEVNRFDLELYERARHLYESRFSSIFSDSSKSESITLRFIKSLLVR